MTEPAFEITFDADQIKLNFKALRQIYKARLILSYRSTDETSRPKPPSGGPGQP